MKIQLNPKHPRLEAINVTTVRSEEFANLIRELEAKREFEKIEGRFVIYRDKGPVIIELGIEGME